MLRLLSRILVGLVVLLIVAAGAVYLLSQRQLTRRYTAPTEPALVVASDSATIAAGEHIYLATSACAHCHGDNAAGGDTTPSNPVLLENPPNLTRGKGGFGERTAEEWERAIRHGIRPDSTSLILMPSDVYSHLSDTDVAALIAYLQQVPPVDRELPRTSIGPMGRALLVAGKLPVLTAPNVVPHGATSAMATDTIERGRYLVKISGCQGCHGDGLSGGPVPGTPPEFPAARNITPTGLAKWSEADFVRAMREGKRPNGDQLDRFMPYEQYRRMSDEELHTLWAYLQTVPGREFGNR